MRAHCGLSIVLLQTSLYCTSRDVPGWYCSTQGAYNNGQVFTFAHGGAVK